MRSPLRFVAPSLLFLALPACFQLDACDFDLGCQSDAECGADEFCNSNTLFGPSCEHAVTCHTDGDCGNGHRCELRPDIPADHPFESSTPQPGICDCSPDCGGGQGGFGSTASFDDTSTVTSGTGAGGRGQGGAGGAGATGAGGAGAMGAGGAAATGAGGAAATGAGGAGGTP
jgi:hypothetical protein